MVDLKGNIFLDGPAGRIEAILKETAAPVTRAAVICHPHPLFGGTMHNKVVYRVAGALHKKGFTVLRFNFRGVGRSDGVHDEGRGEQDDLRSAIDFVVERYKTPELWLAGFSFGARVMLNVACDDNRVSAMIAAGLPVSRYDLTGLTGCSKPKLFVHGERDQFGSVEMLRTLVEASGEPRQLVVIEDADHFFEGKLDRLERVISDFVEIQSAT
ncbi:MAG TPA: alpha/beta fold hydrolase [Blastocatellia bacterium]|nr:alpha/beta fold hydrolase [Blastocatellia bacterium]